MKRLIKQYLNLTIKTKKGLNKEIKRIDEILQLLAQTQVEQNMFIEEFKKQSYKTKCLEEHRKYKELLKKYKELEK